MSSAFPTGTETGPAMENGPRFIPPKIEELAGHFPQLEILKFIGQGGMGAVYEARQKQLDRVVALKILPPQAARGPGFAERFTREARALAKLNHPHIVTLYEFGQADGQFYFLMEFVDGVNLRQLLDVSRMAPEEALAIVPQICDALQYAHERGIVHRDIKPENILLSREGRVKIADFGVAKIMAPAVGEAPAEMVATAPAGELTGAGGMLGTPQYMAPEQIAHPLEVDHRADIYSLGVVFYQMLTGELPAGPLILPSKKVVIDVRLDEVVLRALEQLPERRYQQAGALKTQVETIAATPSPKPTTEKKSKAMTPFKFFCPQCGQRVQCDSDRSGASIHCPACQQAIVVPAAPRAGAPAPAPVRGGAHRWQNILVMTGLVVVLTGLAIVGWQGYSKIKRNGKVRHLPPGLVAFWSGDGTANDAVGGNPGRLVNAAGFAPGKSGRAFILKNGEGGEPGANSRQSGFVQIETTPALDVGKGAGMTFECWIKPVSVTQQMVIVEYEKVPGTYNGADVGLDFAIQDSSVLDANLVDDTPAHSGHVITTPPNRLVAGVWQQVALTYDKDSGQAALYINGTVAAQADLGSFTPQTSFAYLLLGGRTTYGSIAHPRSVFSGEMDEIGIFNRALSAAEIQAIYQKQK